MDDQANANPPGIARVAVPQQMLDNPPPNTGIPITRPGQVPAYTLDDVKAYFLKCPQIAGNARPGTTVVLTKLAFMTSDQAGVELRHQSIHDTNSNIVCLLKFSGTFDLSALSHPYIAGAPPMPDVHNSWLLLDVTNGGEIGWGFFPDNTPSQITPAKSHA